MTIQRAAEEIQRGDVIEYAPGALMLVTIPGTAQQIRYTGRRVIPHGVILTVAEGDDKNVFRIGRPMTRADRPREKVTVYERRVLDGGEGCPCDHHRRARAETGPFKAPPVSDELLVWPPMQPDLNAAYGRTPLGKLPQAWDEQLHDVARGRVYTLDGRWTSAGKSGWQGKPRSARALGGLLALGLIQEAGQSMALYGGSSARTVTLTNLALERYRKYHIDLPARAVEEDARKQLEALPAAPASVPADQDPQEPGEAPAPAPEPEPEAPPQSRGWDWQAEEREEIEAARADVPHTIGVRVAGLLGEGWGAEPFRMFGVNCSAVIHEDGRRIEISDDGSGTHVEVGVWYPADLPVNVYDKDKPVTRFKTDRPVDQLVKVIRNKLLSVYDKRFAEVMQAREESRRRDAHAEAFAERLAAYVPGAEVTRRDPSPWVEGRPGRVGGGADVESVGVEILSGGLHIAEFHYIDAETLEDLMKVYGAHVKVKQARQRR